MNRNRSLIAAVAVAAVASLWVVPPLHAIDVWLSPQGETDLNNNPILFPVNHHAEHGFPYSSGQTNIWFANPDDDPEDDGGITGLGLNMVSTDPGVIEFTNVTIYNPDDSDDFPRWGTTNVEEISPDFIENIFASFGEGMGSGFEGPDPYMDVPSGTWLFATVDYNVIGVGSTDLYLQIGRVGMLANGQSSSGVNVIFGAGIGPEDGSQPDPALNAESQREINSFSRDGSVTAVPEPTSCVLLLVAAVGTVVFSRRRP